MNFSPSSQNLEEFIENENKLKEKEDFNENQHNNIEQIHKEEHSQDSFSLNNKEVTVNPAKISPKKTSKKVKKVKKSIWKDVNFLQKIQYFFS